MLKGHRGTLIHYAEIQGQGSITGQTKRQYYHDIQMSLAEGGINWHSPVVVGSTESGVEH